MEWNDTGIVLSTGIFREADMWVRLLFRNHGLLTAFAFGGAHSRHRFVGCLDVLNTLAAHVRESRRGSYLELTETALLSGTGALRRSPQSLGRAMNCIKFLDALDLTGIQAEGIFPLVEELLALLTPGDAGTTALSAARERDVLLPLVPHFFRLRMASLLGYAPDFIRCGNCGSEVGDDARFLAEDARVWCGACAGTGGKFGGFGIPVSAAGLDVLRNVQQNNPASWHAGDLEPDERRNIARAIDGFVQFYLGVTWDHGRFQRI